MLKKKGADWKEAIEKTIYKQKQNGKSEGKKEKSQNNGIDIEDNISDQNEAKIFENGEEEEQEEENQDNFEDVYEQEEENEEEEQEEDEFEQESIENEEESSVEE